MRVSLYLVAAALFQQPDRDTLLRLRELVSTLLREGHCEESWRPLLVELAGHLFLCDDDLVAEHTRLFVLGVPRVAAQPFASCWLEEEGRLMGRTTLSVREMMAAHGLRADGGLLPDHIVSELEFMAWLAHREGEEPTRGTQRRLLTEHLARWTPLFTAALRRARPSPRFATAAEFLDRLVSWDLENLDPDTRRAGLPAFQGVVQ